MHTLSSPPPSHLIKRTYGVIPCPIHASPPSQNTHTHPVAGTYGGEIPGWGRFCLGLGLGLVLGFGLGFGEVS
jgi:hypothetical protein